MCETRNSIDIIKEGDTFWAYDKYTNKKADQTGPCMCLDVHPWAIYAVDIVGNERVFLRHKFNFERE